jgi:hypothetical protein
VLLGIAATAATPLCAAPAPRPASARRIGTGPIITPTSHPSIGGNINGPALIRVPDWIERPLGRYYLYFAAHAGRSIRLAYADALEGPWNVHAPGTLRIEQTPFPTRLARAHIASPDVHVDHANKRIILYYHGLEGEPNLQLTRAAVSADGLTFTASKTVLGLPYMRVFRYRDAVHGLAMPGQFYRSTDPLSGFRSGPHLFDQDMRHAAVAVRGDRLKVAWTRVGDAPERILLSTIDAAGPWETWRETDRTELLRPALSWEGARLPLTPSNRGIVTKPVNQLRDPGYFEEDGRLYMVYAVAGESGLALAEVSL